MSFDNCMFFMHFPKNVYKLHVNVVVFPATNGFDLLVWLFLTEDVEVDVESIMFDCVDSDGLSITHTGADHCYSSMDKAWL